MIHDTLVRCLSVSHRLAKNLPNVSSSHRTIPYAWCYPANAKLLISSTQVRMQRLFTHQVGLSLALPRLVERS